MILVCARPLLFISMLFATRQESLQTIADFCLNDEIITRNVSQALLSLTGVLLQPYQHFIASSSAICSLSLSLRIYIYIYIHISIYLSLSLYMCVHIYLSIYLSLSLNLSLSLYIYICMYIYIYIYISIYISRLGTPRATDALDHGLRVQAALGRRLLISLSL